MSAKTLIMFGNKSYIFYNDVDIQTARSLYSHCTSLDQFEDELDDADIQFEYGLPIS
jgi:hypothetical protein